MMGGKLWNTNMFMLFMCTVAYAHHEEGHLSGTSSLKDHGKKLQLPCPIIYIYRYSAFCLFQNMATRHLFSTIQKDGHHP